MSKSSDRSVTFLLGFLAVNKMIKMVKLAKIAKPAVTFVSMLLSMFAYAFSLGPWFAIGLVLMLFVHEMGHVIALRLKGYEASTPVFIPFLGAAVFAPKFRDKESEAYVGYGGPLLGSIGAAMLFGVWFLMPDDSIAADIVLLTSHAAVYLNLFNMIPVSPLDGGRVTQIAGPAFQYIGMITLAIFSIAIFRQPAILLIWILVASELRIISWRSRAVIAALCTFAMLALMSLGYSHQPWWVDCLDVIVAIGLTLSFAWLARAKYEDPVDTDQQIEPTVKQRIWWLLLYAILTVALVLLAAYQVTLLPQVPA